MSDGPHKSLPMRPRWKRFAECADKAAYDPDQVAEAVIPALEEDWREEVAPHLSVLRKLVGDDKQASLFGEPAASALEGLKRLQPGASLWGAVVDGVAQAVVDGRTGDDVFVEGIGRALRDRGTRGVRTAEEHYLRKANESRALNLRTRMLDGISRAPIESMVRRVLGFNSDSTPERPRKRKGLDDGVRL